MIIMGLDVSLTSTGLVVWDGESVLKHLVIKPPGPQKACFEKRADYIILCIELQIEAWQPDLVVIEAPSYGPSPPIGLWQIYGIVKHFLWGIEQPFYDAIAPTALKKSFTGSGRASKDDMIAVARQWLPDLTSKDDDVADALALAQYGYDNYESIIE